MAKAIWNGDVIAESAETVVVDGYTYFPRAALKAEHFAPSAHTSVCGWKGTASYFDVKSGDQVNENAAWTYETPKPEAKHIQGWVSFWKGVRIEP